MSYEGYYQLICENNHYSTVDCYSFSNTHSRCEHCGAKFSEKNSVDETNGTSDGYDPDFGKDAIKPVVVMSDQLSELQSKLALLEYACAEQTKIISSNLDAFNNIAEKAEAWTPRETRHFAKNAIQLISLRLELIEKNKKKIQREK